MVKSFEDYEALVDVASNAVSSGVDFVRNLQTQVFEANFIGNDAKLLLDQELNHLLETCLEKSEVRVISEEGQGPESSATGLEGIDFAWVIDPLDGSYNYLRGIPHCAISVALVEQGRPVIGVIGNLVSGDIYVGGTSVTPTKNGVPMEPLMPRAAETSVVASGFPVGTERTGVAIQKLEELISRFGKVRMFGSAAMSLALLSEGAVDCYFEHGIFIWDVAAGWALAEALGASVRVADLGGFRVSIEVSTGAIGNEERL